MITVFTPTYNRSHLLPRLYDSLCKQTNNDFEWLVIDDCSTDNTEDYIKSLRNGRFDIRYYKTAKNSGKHIAFNLAIEKARGEYFFCVDSDDWLDVKAVDIIINDIKDDSLLGFIYPRISDALDNRGWEIADNNLIDIIDAELVYGIKETAIVIKTSSLKKYKFPTFEKEGVVEKFCPESILYNELISEGKFLAKNKGFYFGEYQENGLTNSIRKLWLNCPQAMIYDWKLKYEVYKKYKLQQRFLQRTLCILDLNALCIKKKISILNNTPSKLYSILLYLPSIPVVMYRYKW